MRVEIQLTDVPEEMIDCEEVYRRGLADRVMTRVRPYGRVLDVTLQVPQAHDGGAGVRALLRFLGVGRPPVEKERG